MKRILLRKLTLSDSGKPDAILIFKAGLNVITGDSDTGKTYAFQCLNYILGSEKPPKNIAEATGYSIISLKFTVDDEVYLLERTIESNKIAVTHNEEKIELSCKHDATSSKNLSRYLLQLLQGHDQNKFLKKNKSNETRTLSFRDIVHLITVGETDIIAETSAFQSIQYTERTVSKSVLKYIITGVDDSNIVKIEDSTDENIKRTGVVQFLQKKKEILKDKISAIEEDKHYKLFASSNSMQDMIEKIKVLRGEISKANAMITNNQTNIQSLEKACFSDEIKIKEFQKLKQHYQEELKRNVMVATYSDFLLQTPALNCPVCRQIINHAIIDPANAKNLFEYYKFYMVQLTKKIDGLSSSIEDILERISKEKDIIKSLTDDNVILIDQIKKNQEILMDLSKNISAIRQLDAMQNSLEIYRQELVLVEGDIIAYSEKVTETKKSSRNQDATLYDAYCLAIENVLKSWGFSDELKVTFDVETLDLFINKKARSGWGKGYRAFFMSAMVIGLMRYCLENNKLHPGFVILDSPLVSFKERKRDPDGSWVDDYMERKMIDDIIEHDCFSQVIIFENKSIKYDYDYNYVEFNHDGDGRKGFIPFSE